MQNLIIINKSIEGIFYKTLYKDDCKENLGNCSCEKVATLKFNLISDKDVNIGIKFWGDFSNTLVKDVINISSDTVIIQDKDKIKSSKEQNFSLIANKKNQNDLNSEFIAYFNLSKGDNIITITFNSTKLVRTRNIVSKYRCDEGEYIFEDIIYANLNFSLLNKPDKILNSLTFNKKVFVQI